MTFFLHVKPSFVSVGFSQVRLRFCLLVAQTASKTPTKQRIFTETASRFSQLIEPEQWISAAILIVWIAPKKTQKDSCTQAFELK
jgi:ABC-type uncharacterized transport system auxiliary subunit